jgi:phage/plasmid-like protein (TIGR03299 family)
MMVANVETMFFVGETPWHGLGEKLDSPPTIAEAITQSGLDWEVGLKQLYTAEGAEVPAKATYRLSDNSILGVVGPRYTPLQNQDAFGWFQPFVDSGLVNLHTAGSLQNGKKIWVLADINREPSEIAPGDEVAKFIMLSNSHDGTTAIRVGFTPIRIVCANTLAMAHKSSASKLIRVRHTTSSRVNLDKLREIMDLVNSEFEATAEQFRFLASRYYKQADIRKYVKAVLGVERVDDADLPTRTKNTMDSIFALIENERQSVGGIRGTWWAAYNGVNEYFNYQQGRNADNRLNSLWFGSGYSENARALDLAQQFSLGA